MAAFPTQHPMSSLGALFQTVHPHLHGPARHQTHSKEISPRTVFHVFHPVGPRERKPNLRPTARYSAASLCANRHSGTLPSSAARRRALSSMIHSRVMGMALRSFT